MPGSTKSTTPVRKLLVTRREAMAMLGASVEVIRDYEARGWLTAIKGSAAKQSHVRYMGTEIEALVERLHAEAKAAFEAKADA